MNFANNFMAPAVLPLGATALTVSLPDGSYRLTLTDSLSAPTVWEIVGAVVVAGSASLSRGQEGTAAREWPAGSLIYCAVTAGVLTDMLAQIAALELRVTALEPLPVTSAVVVTVGLDSGIGKLGYFDGSAGFVGSVSPGSFDIPGVGACAVLEASSINYGAEGVGFDLYIAGTWAPSLLESVDVPGIGLLTLASANQAEVDTEEGRVLLAWIVPPGAGWAVSDERTITLTFA